MEQRLHRYFLGAVAFALVVVWATLGATDAVVAAVACLVAVNAHRLVPRLQAAPRRPVRPERRPRLTTRPLHAEDARPHPLVPDDPSLIITTSP